MAAGEWLRMQEPQFQSRRNSCQDGTNALLYYGTVPKHNNTSVQ
jgi:hypothetical protein